MKSWCSWIGVIGVCLTAGLFAQTPDDPTHDYHLPDSVAAHYLNHSLADARTLALKLTTPFSGEHQKYRAIFRWVCANIRSDYSLYAKVKQMRKRYSSDPTALAIWNQKFNHELFEQLRKKRSTVCTGYAYLIRTLAQHAGIRCEIVDGYARNSQSNLGGPGIANHSWNAVRLDSTWYLSDATWASGQVYGPEGFYIPHFEELYFLVAPESFARSHYPLDTAQLFHSNKQSLSDFLHAPLAYAANYKYRLEPVSHPSFFILVNKDDAVPFVIQKVSNKSIQQLTLQANDDVIVFSERGCENAVRNYQCTYKFNRRGMSVVHVVADGHPVFSYRVKVK
ncbi:MAG: transglutaminase domain-containing protein [Cyclobacteriaceae bacterium]